MRIAMCIIRFGIRKTTSSWVVTVGDRHPSPPDAFEDQPPAYGIHVVIDDTARMRPDAPTSARSLWARYGDRRSITTRYDLAVSMACYLMHNTTYNGDLAVSYVHDPTVHRSTGMTDRALVIDAVANRTSTLTESTDILEATKTVRADRLIVITGDAPPLATIDSLVASLISWRRVDLILCTDADAIVSPDPRLNVCTAVDALTRMWSVAPHETTY